MNIIFECAGGIGKSIMASAVVSALKKQYPDSDIIVVTAYPEVFTNNPEVHRALPFGSLYFYETYIKSDTKILKLEPYHTEDFIKGKKHLIEIWCDLFSIPYNGELPKLYLSEYEISNAKLLKGKRPLLVIQPFGGSNTNIKYSWNRDIPFSQAMELVKKYEKEYDILQIARGDQPTVAKRFTASFREVAALIAVSDKRIFIDSFSQHVAATLKLTSTVCWVTNSPNVFGYDIHTNILSRPFDKEIRPIESYLERFDFTGTKNYQYPYNNDKVFDITTI